jgi:hypothetical protein
VHFGTTRQEKSGNPGQNVDGQSSDRQSVDISYHCAKILSKSLKKWESVFQSRHGLKNTIVSGSRRFSANKNGHKYEFRNHDPDPEMILHVLPTDFRHNLS